MSEHEHKDHVAVEGLYEYCAIGDCEHEGGECPWFKFETCIDCMDESGAGRDPDAWEDRPLMPWPHEGVPA